jgi:hypothetical protein
MHFSSDGMPQKLEERIAGFHLPPLTVMENGEPIKNREAWLKRRAAIITLLQQEMYGVTPAACPVSAKILKEDNSAYADKACETTLEIILTAPGGTASFPVTLIVPKKKPIKGVFINIAFMIRGTDGFRYCPSCPVEEIIDAGFAITLYDYLDVAGDDGDFARGIAGVFPRETGTGWGKIGMWAYSMSRVADYLKTRSEFEGVPFIALGFSRLGKTALWCGVQDERFDFVMPLGSGTGGVGFTRGNKKESIGELQSRNWYWFCGNFKRYSADAYALPFDQHFALAACAPRKLLTVIGESDEWADIENEYLSCIAAGEGYVLAGAKGFIAPDEFPRGDSFFSQGDIAFGLRRGTHFLSRADWRMAIDYIGVKCEG